MTILEGQGGKSSPPMDLLVRVVQWVERRELRDLVRAFDPSAFVVVFEASDVMGYFRHRTAIDYWRKRSDRAEA